MNPTHCTCGYEFADGMKFCPYCGHKRSLIALADELMKGSIK